MRKSILLILVFITILNSCKKEVQVVEQGFVKTGTKDLTIFLLDSVVKFDNPMQIDSFNLTYNPKSNGYVKLLLQNGDTYEAKSVDGGSFSSIHSLLKEQTVQFDTIRKEIVIQKSINN